MSTAKFQRLWVFVVVLISLVVLAACATQAPATSQPAAPAAKAPEQKPAEQKAPAAAPTTAPAAPPAAAQPVPGGKLTIAYVPGAAHLDSNSVNISTVNEVTNYFYETLFDRDQATGQLKPHLVKEEQVSADGLTITWKLQPGVKFHDGTNFDAKAVKWNLDRKITKKQPLADLLPIDTIEAVDDTTVRVKMKSPFPGLNAYLATKTFSMYSPTFSEKVGDDALKQQGMGTGPFILEEFKTNELVRLKKNPNYWQKGLPYLDEVTFRIVPNASTRTTQLEAGDIDIALQLPFPDIQKFRSTKGFKVVEDLGSQQYYIALNNRRAPLNDAKVRQALNYAVDREGMLKTVLLGNAEPAKAVLITSRVDGYAVGANWTYDVNKAKQLLDEAGWKANSSGMREKDGKALSIELLTRKGAASGDFEIAELLQGMLKAVGVDVKVNVQESATFLQKLNRAGEPEYDMVNLLFGSFPGDAHYVVNTVYASDAVPPRYYNYSWFGNPAVDKMIEDSRKAPNRAERDKIYAEIIKKVADEASAIPLFDVKQIVTMRDNVNGVFVERAGNNFPAKWAWKSK